MKTIFYFVDDNSTIFTIKKNNNNKHLLIQLINGKKLEFKDSKHVDEFCELLQSEKDEIWR